MLLAVFNDGAMIALSKDKVTPSRIPNRWNLNSIFITGIVYGLYLTLSSWVGGECVRGGVCVCVGGGGALGWTCVRSVARAR